MITASQIDHVRSSFVHCIPLSQDVAAHFYADLFARAPETRALFAKDMEEQGRKLVMTLAAVVDGLDRLETLVPVVRELAIRHVRYGVRADHYALVGAALIETLRVQLGALFDAATEDAWGAAYALLAETMIAAAEGR